MRIVTMPRVAARFSCDGRTWYDGMAFYVDGLPLQEIGSMRQIVSDHPIDAPTVERFMSALHAHRKATT